MRENKKAGRQKGVRSERVNQALQKYFSSNDSISYIAKTNNIDRSGLSRAIKATKKSAIEILEDNTPRDFQSQELRMQMLSNIETIQRLTMEALEELDLETTKLREVKQMDLNNINQSFKILQKASETIGYSELIEQINSNNKPEQRKNIL